ncbi:MAG: FG-GAP-like repeat-containing protein [bacterium]|nr:FG-GAP-like repeat-containing protein [bacterium]
MLHSVAFAGYLDDVNVWAAALTSLQVFALANGSMTPFYQLGSTPDGGSHSANVNGPYSVVEDLDFGVDEFQAIRGATRGNFLQSNGTLDPNAEPLANRMLTLRDSNNRVVATTQSQADGSFFFPGVPTGTYTIEQSEQAGWQQTAPLVPNFQLSAGTTLQLNSPTAISMASGDFDQDGTVDLAFVYPDQAMVRVYWQPGVSNSYTSYPLPLANSVKIVAANIRGNGLQDLAVLDKSGTTILLANQKAAGAERSNLFQISTISNWSLPSSVAPVSAMIGDFDEDGREDLIVQYNSLTSSASDGFALLPGSFAKATTYSIPGSLAVGYLNSDRYLDVAVNSGNEHINFLYGDGNGRFPNSDVFPSDATLNDLQADGPLAIADINSDGVPDIVYPGQVYGQYNIEGLFLDGSVIPNTGFAVFLGSPVPTLRVGVTDLDGDLRPDLAVLPLDDNGVHAQLLHVLTNNGLGTVYFNDAELFGPNNVNLIDQLFTDLNDDGLTDVVLLGTTTSGSSNAYIFLNQTTSDRRITVPLGADVGSDDNIFISGQVTSILGVVYDDGDGNGLRTASDPGLSNSLVYLDLNRNQVLDAAEPQTITRADGSFAFTNVPDGTYDVRLAPEHGRVPTGDGLASREVTVRNGSPLQPYAFEFGTAQALLNPLPDVTLEEGARFSVALSRTLEGQSRQLLFSLEMNAPTAASVDKRTGLFSWDPSGDEGPGIYFLTVWVQDQDVPSMQQSYPFTITIVPTTPPTISLSPSTAPENLSGLTIGNLSVSGPGILADGFIVNDERFEVQGNALKLKPDVALDGQQEASVSIEVTAYNSGKPVLSQTVVINVLPNPFPWQNRVNHLDSNSDGYVSPIDVLVIVNLLNMPYSLLTPTLRLPPWRSAESELAYFDVNGDSYATAIDVLNIINFLNDSAADAEGEGEGPSVRSSLDPATADPSEIMSPNFPLPLKSEVWADEFRSSQGTDAMVDLPLMHADELYGTDQFLLWDHAMEQYLDDSLNAGSANWREEEPISSLVYGPRKYLSGIHSKARFSNPRFN